MIRISDARKRIGDGVVYQPHPAARSEDGVITSVSSPDEGGLQVVFVRYAGDTISKATYPADLEWLAQR